MRNEFIQDDDLEDESEEYILRNRKRITSMFDESVEVVGADDVQSPPLSAGIPGLKGFPTMTNVLSQEKKASEKIIEYSDRSDNSEDEDDDDDDDDVRAPIIQGAYNAVDYDELAVSEEIKDVFNYIKKYTPQNIDLENKLYPFLPDFIPAVGDIDAFVKILRPDGKKDNLGLIVLDEPCTQQSDPAVLQLQLRAVAKQSSAKALVVKKIENAEKNGKSIDKWIKAISDLHSSKPLPTVQYTKPMPSIDNLMQEWPAEFEENLNQLMVPNPDLECDLGTYVTIICNVFDIPVYDSKIEALHTFFSLYSTIKNTQEII